MRAKSPEADSQHSTASFEMCLFKYFIYVIYWVPCFFVVDDLCESFAAFFILIPSRKSDVKKFPIAWLNVGFAAFIL